MIIVQIIEFELRDPQGRTCTPKTGHFYGETKISRDKFSIELLFTRKILQDAVYTLHSLTWAKSPTKFNPEMQNFERVLGLPLK